MKTEEIVRLSKAGMPSACGEGILVVRLVGQMLMLMAPIGWDHVLPWVVYYGFGGGCQVLLYDYFSPIFFKHKLAVICMVVVIEMKGSYNNTLTN